MEYDKLSDQLLGKPSTVIQKRVEVARKTQRRHFHVAEDHHSEEKDAAIIAKRGGSIITRNADMRPVEVRQYSDLDGTSRILILSAMNQWQLSHLPITVSSSWRTYSPT